MRINNPKSLVNFTRSAANTPDALAYNLATIGQLKRAINNLDAKFDNILAPGKQTIGSNGYAWLNKDGQVDTSLLPPLAITETHVITQSELKAIKDANEGQIPEKEVLSYLLDLYVKNKINTESKKYQKGDIVIVQPTETETGDKELPNPIYSGSYIIIETPDEGDIAGGSFKFAKIAYTDSNIVKINGLAPANSAGELHIYLKDILQEVYLYNEGANVNFVEAEAKAKELSDTVYRLKTIDEGEAGFRFGFVDNSSVDGGVIPYAKLAELQALDNREADDYNTLTNAIADLTHTLVVTSGNLHNETVTASGNLHDEIITTSSYLYDLHNTEVYNVSSFLYSELDITSSYLQDEVNFISGTIGDSTLPGDRSESAPIFAQTRKLRQDVDDNLNLLNRTRQHTNEYLELIQQNVRNLHGKLNEKAIMIVEKEIEWTAENSTSVMTPISETERLEYQVSNPDVTGIITWTYKYEPTELNEPGSTANNERSQERIIGVYDANGNEIMVDINRKQLTNGLMGSYLSIETEYVGNETDGSYVNSLIGTKWTLLVAKTIVNIDLVDATFAVGGNLETAETIIH